MAASQNIEIAQEGRAWVLRVTAPGKRSQEYRCATRDQAQSLANVLCGQVRENPPRRAPASLE